MMWSLCKLFLLFVLATVCHWGMATLFAFVGINMNAMLVFAVAVAAILKPGVGYPVAFMCGLFLDFFGTKLFGNNAFSFTVAACLVYSLAERFDFEGIFPQMFTVFGLTVLVTILNSLLLLLFTSSAMWPGFLNLLGGALMGSLLAPIVFWSVRKILGKSFLSRLS